MPEVTMGTRALRAAGGIGLVAVWAIGAAADLKRAE
jgi:hypothetical protein